MSEDDRAVKAARARALLKKKQQQKAAGGGSVASPTVPSPVLPPSRTYSLAPSEITLTHPMEQRLPPPRAYSPAPSETPFTSPAKHKDGGNVGDL
ncbi:hypothetical protein DAEQUDRAFT_554533 [Daedalea quercina L-15889]|uniref:Uncharacterized protein n=1 Tax=Daedalea quercina L-15889 TaxID=1314783 RepID=A0A165T516_9APHY|nr:hypothetical protein DAEQUDRAFT_554533 [Daedalea quercina L-15889]